MSLHLKIKEFISFVARHALTTFPLNLPSPTHPPMQIVSSPSIDSSSPSPTPPRHLPSQSDGEFNLSKSDGDEEMVSAAKTEDDSDEIQDTKWIRKRKVTVFPPLSKRKEVEKGKKRSRVTKGLWWFNHVLVH